MLFSMGRPFWGQNYGPVTLLAQLLINSYFYKISYDLYMVRHWPFHDRVPRDSPKDCSFDAKLYLNQFYFSNYSSKAWFFISWECGYQSASCMKSWNKTGKANPRFSQCLGKVVRKFLLITRVFLNDLPHLPSFFVIFSDRWRPDDQCHGGPTRK